MKTLFFYLALCFAACGMLSTPALAQSRPEPTPHYDTAPVDYQQADYVYSRNLFAVNPSPTTYDNIVSEATYLTINMEELARLIELEPRQLVLSIPTADGGQLEMLLRRAFVHKPGAKAYRSDNPDPLNPKWGLHYRGELIDRNRPDISGKNSLVALSLFENQVIGVMSFDGTNHVLGFLGDKAQGPTENYVLYRENKLLIPNTLLCLTEDTEEIEPFDPLAENKSLTRKQITIYSVMDYEYYNNLWGANYTNAFNYMTALFNIVFYLYEREDVSMFIDGAFMFTTNDPFHNTNINTTLSNFKNWINGFSVDNSVISHLMSGANLGGGLAYVDVLCNNDDGTRTAVSDVDNSFNFFPTYSWSSYVVTHELGHNLGSQHTHACVWNGNNTRIDNCGGQAGYPEGTCTNSPAVVNGGTIMSYCHLTSDGINFLKGFGTQPGNRIRNKINAASCLAVSNLYCDFAVPISCGESINGTTVGQTSNSSNYAYYSTGWTNTPLPYTYTGPEDVYVVHVTQAGSLTASLTNESGAFDVIIFQSCNNNNALEYGFSSATVSVQPGTYYIVVEGYSGSSGTYTLTVNCSGLCPSWGSNSAFEWLENVTIGNINNTSGNNFGYKNFSSLTLQTGISDVVNVKLTPGFSGSVYNENFAIYIDYNKDNQYSSSEQVFSATGNAAVLGNFTVPLTAQLGITNMRVIMSFQAINSGCNQQSFGEVEDYKINISQFCPSKGKTTEEWIQSVQLGSNPVVNSGNNGGFYAHPSPLSIQTGIATPGTFTPGYNGGPFNETWRWFVDANDNGSFETTILDLPAQTGVRNANVVVPTFVWGGVYPSRLVMKWSTAASNACVDDFFGETEQYDLEVCGRKAGSTTDEWINSVTIANMFKSTGNNNGYVLNYDTSYVFQGGHCALTLSPGFSGSAYNEQWAVYVDWNGDGAFVVSERVFTGSGNGAVNGSFVVPASTAPGTYRVRVFMKYGSAPENGCFVGFYYGEMEDYFLNVSSNVCTGITVAPQVVQASLTSAHIIWNRIPGAINYNLQWRVQGATAWNPTIVIPAAQGTSFTLEGLTTGVVYEYRMRVRCPSGFTAYSTSWTFTLTTTFPACNRPLVHNTTQVSATSQRILWVHVPNATQYRIRHRLAGLGLIIPPGSWVIVPGTITSTSFLLTGLLSNRKYDYQIQSLCPAGWSSWSTIGSFTTLGNGMSLQAHEPGLDNLPETTFDVLLAPNPTDKHATLTVSNSDDVIAVELIDVNGRLIEHWSGMPANDRLDVAALPAGVYFVKVELTTGERVVRQLMKN